VRDEKFECKELKVTEPQKTNQQLNTARKAMRWNNF
jgi:hypothetical protein